MTPPVGLIRDAPCTGCCTCARKELPITPTSAEATPSYLLPADVSTFFRPIDFFQVQVVHQVLDEDPERHHRAQLEAAWKFQGVHGRAQLIKALAMARGMPEGLDGPLADLLDRLQAEVRT